MLGGFSADSLRDYQSEMSRWLGDWDFTECVDTFDFRLCQRDDGSYYGTAGTCRKGKEATRDSIVNQLKKKINMTPNQEAQIRELGDESLVRLMRRIGESQGKQPKKTKHAGLMPPAEAAKYAEFFESGKTAEPVRDVSLDAVRKLVESGTIPKSDVSKAAAKGQPREGTLKDHGWASRTERGEAVIKFIIDHDSKDVTGTHRDWKGELQLDHKIPLSMGGKDEPSNWQLLWIPANQRKGDVEKSIAPSLNGADRKQTEAVLNASLSKAFRDNARMGEDEVKRLHLEGESSAARKDREVKAYKAELPILPSEERASMVATAKGEKLKLLYKASTRGGYRLKMGKGGRGDYPTVGAQKALLKLRWGEKLSPADVSALREDAKGQPPGYLQKLLKAYAPDR